MQKQKNYNTETIYFTERLQKKMKTLLQYPCTLLEAPMGYGKTTAIREFLKGQESRVIWHKIHDSSLTVFWSTLCFNLRDVDIGISESLTQIGFPNDSASREKVLQLFIAVIKPGKLVVVLDDYHLIDGPEINSFIEFLLWNELPDFHLVLTTRFTRFINLEELTLKGYLHHITKELLEFSPEEIIAYYNMCGFKIKDKMGIQLYNYTEGWISALYLLMLNYKEEGSFDMIGHITKLIEKAIYHPFSDEIKVFLMTLCFFDGFTLEQSAHMWQKENAKELLAEIMQKNAFINYDEKSKLYHVHKIFREFLKEIFEEAPQEFKNTIYHRAAHWYEKEQDYMASMRYYYKANDFDKICDVMIQDKGYSMYYEYQAELTTFFEACPVEILKRYPLALLIYALCLFSYNDIENFEKVCDAFKASLVDNDALSEELLRELQGEFEILSSFLDYNDITKMLDHFQKAYAFLNQPAKIIDAHGNWTFGSPSVLYMFYRETGQLKNEVDLLKEAMPSYNKLIKGHGKGAEFVMEAEMYFNQGDLISAEIIIHKAIYQANQSQQEDILLCATFLRARIALVKGDYTYVMVLLSKLREEMEQKKWYNLMHSMDLCEAFIQAGLKEIKEIPKWITEGDFESSRLYFPARAFMNIVYGRVLLIQGDYQKLLGISDQFIEIASVFPNLLGQIYTYIYCAAAEEAIYRHQNALNFLKQALDMASPDGMVMPFVENCDFIKPLLAELQGRPKYSETIQSILRLYVSYETVVKQISKDNFIRTTLKLASREMEIAQLVAEGLSNSEIGIKLYISQNTVKTLLKRIFIKLNISSRTMLKDYIESQS